MATELLCMQGFGVEACEATIISVSSTDDNRSDIILDQTCFYARGGGQDWDMGTIKSANGSFAVEEVRLDESGAVHHVGTFKDGQFKEGGGVECEVDHDRRAINMRLHSGAHVIDMAVADLGLDWIGTKGQHYPHLSAVEYSGTWDPDKAEELRAKLQQRTNEFIEQGSVNSIRFMPVSEMHTVCRHVPDNIPTNKLGRVVMYGESFGVPCGGTHVKDIHEVGKVTIPRIKEKKGVIRVSYAVEGIGAE
jgi:Ser-tRNA(Ala) deacylase AlaX